MDGCYGRSEDNGVVFLKEGKPYISRVFNGESSTFIMFVARGSGRTTIDMIAGLEEIAKLITFKDLTSEEANKYLGDACLEFDDNDSDVDLFGEETLEQKKGAKERAAVVKASEKRRNCLDTQVFSYQIVHANDRNTVGATSSSYEPQENATILRNPMARHINKEQIAIGALSRATAHGLRIIVIEQHDHPPNCTNNIVCSDFLNKYENMRTKMEADLNRGNEDDPIEIKIIKQEMK
nr:kinesin-like protein KIN-10C [Tanacetum cinerariifolium]GEV17643.1 kinesin-like protein KIN-10C [Tanacetum cinerariifolium]